MIPLPAAAVIEDARAAPLLAHLEEARGDLADCGVPVDFLESAVGPPPHRRGQPIPAILVVVNPLRLLAGIALRRDMLPVTADTRDMPSLELHLDSAIDTAQDANRLLPVFTHGTTPELVAVSVHLSNYIVQQENELCPSLRQTGAGVICHSEAPHSYFTCQYRNICTLARVLSPVPARRRHIDKNRAAVDEMNRITVRTALAEFHKGNLQRV